MNLSEQQQRGLVAALVLTSVLLVGILGLTLYVANTIKTESPLIVAQMTEERLDDAKSRLSARMVEAKEIANDLLTWVQEAVENNRRLKRIYAAWTGIRFEANSIALMVAAFPEEPIKTTAKFFEEGPMRTRQILDQAQIISLEIQELLPKLADSFSSARKNFQEDGLIRGSVAALDALVLPLVSEDPQEMEKWQTIKGAIFAWANRVSDDFAEFESALSSDAMSRDFARRLSESLF